MCSPQELDQVFVLLKSLVTQGEPGAWDWGLLHTGLYSLKRKPGQLDSGFQAGKEHPRKKKKKSCLDLQEIENPSRWHVWIFGQKS